MLASSTTETTARIRINSNNENNNNDDVNDAPALSSNTSNTSSSQQSTTIRDMKKNSSPSSTTTASATSNTSNDTNTTATAATATIHTKESNLIKFGLIPSSNSLLLCKPCNPTDGLTLGGKPINAEQLKTLGPDDLIEHVLMQNGEPVSIEKLAELLGMDDDVDGGLMDLAQSISDPDADD